MTQDVVIIGAGIAGVSLAEHLLRLEPGMRVLLADAHHVGAGSTSRSLAAFRHQWSVPAHVAFSKYSSEDYDRLSEMGYALEFRRNGYLFLYTDPDRWRRAQERAARQRELGVEVDVLETLDPTRVPCAAAVEDADVIGATWGSRDGFLDPLAVAQAYLDLARHRGLTYRPGWTPAGIDRDRTGKVIAVSFGTERIATERLVLAAGIWSASIAQDWGMSLPLIAAKRYIYHSRPVRDLDVSRWPLVIGDRGQHCRPSEGNTLMVSWEHRPEVRSHVPGPEALWDEQDAIEPGFGVSEYGIDVLTELARHLPVLAEAVSLWKTTSGWYANTLDGKAILGPDPRLPGLFLATAFSGHGIMHGGATGRVMAELLLGRPPSLLSAALLEREFGVEPLREGRARSPVEEMGL